MPNVCRASEIHTQQELFETELDKCRKVPFNESKNIFPLAKALWFQKSCGTMSYSHKLMRRKIWNNSIWVAERIVGNLSCWKHGVKVPSQKKYCLQEASSFPSWSSRLCDWFVLGPNSVWALGMWMWIDSVVRHSSRKERLDQCLFMLLAL